MYLEILKANSDIENDLKFLQSFAKSDLNSKFSNE